MLNRKALNAAKAVFSTKLYKSHRLVETAQEVREAIRAEEERAEPSRGCRKA
jgi:hypothetical protein